VTPPPFPIVIGNTLNGSATGVELTITVQPADWWRAEVSYTGQDVSITRDPASRDVGGGVTEANDPAHLFSFRHAIDAPAGVELDVRFRRVGALPRPLVPGYNELDFRVGWVVSPQATIAIIGQDMLHDRHPEFSPAGSAFEEFERSLRVSLTLRSR
jgi:iron complex outermembrane receptor protein